MTRWLVRDRVTVASVAVMAVGLAVLGIATNVVLSQQLAHDARALLQERTSALLGGIVVRQGRLEALDINDGAIDRQSWIYRNHRAIERPIAPRNLQRAADRISRSRRTVDLTLGESTGLRATPVRAPDGTRLGTVVVATSLEPYEHSERIARVATIVLSLLVLGLCALVARRAVGSALRPVGNMAANASDWSEHHLDRRFALGPPRDELTSLAATLDGLLARVDSALRHEQRFSAEMAHELRTPLAGVRAQAELMLRAADSLGGSALEGLRSILAACDRMASSIETLLLSARVTEAGGSSDPVAAIDEVVAALGPAATAAKVKIELQD